MKAIAVSMISQTDNFGPFKLFCDSLRPDNVLVNDSLEVVAVTNWAFSYAAPAQFAGSMPWWLLLERPHDIIDKYDVESFKSYYSTADKFLLLLKQKEQERGMDTAKDRLSQRMWQSLKDRSAWFTLACRDTASMDLLYWCFLDEFCWGPDSDTVLDAPMHWQLKGFKKKKIQDLKQYYRDMEEDPLVRPLTQAERRFMTNREEEHSGESSPQHSVLSTEPSM